MPKQARERRTIEELQKDKENPRRLAAMIRKVVAAWDLEDTDGSPIPLAQPPEGAIDPLFDIPTSIFNAIIIAVREDNLPGEQDPSDAS